MDVTRRYVRSTTQAAPRPRCPESVLVHILDEIRSLRRQKFHINDKFRLQGEYMAEQKELQTCILSGIAAELCKLDYERLLRAMERSSSHAKRPSNDPERQRRVEAEEMRRMFDLKDGVYRAGNFAGYGRGEQDSSAPSASRMNGRQADGT